MQDGRIFILALDVICVTVQFVQSSPERLAIINLPESDTSFQAAVILIIQRHELGQVEAFQMVKIPETKGNAAILRMSGNVLHLFVKILAKFCFVGVSLERNAIAQQIRNCLSCEIVVPIRRDFVVWRPNVRHLLAELIVNEFLKPHDRWVLVLVIQFRIISGFV